MKIFNFSGLCSIIFGSILWLYQIHTGYVFKTFLSAYLDDLCQKNDYSNNNYSATLTTTITNNSTSPYLSSLQLIQLKRKISEFEMNGCNLNNNTINYILPKNICEERIEEDSTFPRSSSLSGLTSISCNSISLNSLKDFNDDNKTTNIRKVWNRNWEMPNSPKINHLTENNQNLPDINSHMAKENKSITIISTFDA